MHSFNLIPAHRILKRKRALRLSIWMSISVCYGALVIVFCHVSVARYKVANQHDLETQVQTVINEIATSKRNLTALKQEYDEAERVLQAANALGSQPDWSILLTALASHMGDNIVLQSCVLMPLIPPPSPDAPTESPPHDPQGVTGYSLKVTGFGRTQGDVSDFVLRLEGMVLLDTVSLISSRREPFLADNAIVFEIRCSIKGDGRGER